MKSSNSLSDSKKTARSIRSPFPSSIPKSRKRKLDGTNAGLVPAHIRVFGVKLNKDERVVIRRRLGEKLGKFRASIERVSVRVEDVNGPRGGIDMVCRVKVVLSGLPSVVFEARNASLNMAVRAALAGTERIVRRTLQRKRVKPMQVAKRPDRLSRQNRRRTFTGIS